MTVNLPRRLCKRLAVLPVFLLQFLSGLQAATTIDTTNAFAHGANLGWMDWRGDTNNGAVIGEFVCSGFIYSANAGWINLGSGAPTNGIRYLNLAGSDYGINHDGLGNLRGYAYGANIGWLGFEDAGAPKVDLVTGKFSGLAYSANCGWISLSNAFALVQTLTIAPGADTDTDGLADAWERNYFGNLAQNAEGDFDNDGLSNLAEYLAATNPNDPNDKLMILDYSTTPGGTLGSLTWKSAMSRQYNIQKTIDLETPLWVDAGLGLISPDGATTTRSFSDTNAPMRFYRIRASQPLAP